MLGRKKKKNAKEHHHIRQLMDGDFNPIESLEKAQHDPSGYVIFHGDEGGQIYATIPAKQVNCSEAKLREILHKIDARYWNDPRSADVYYEHGMPGNEIPGGMGGGRLENELWVHTSLKEIYGIIKKDLTKE